MFFLKQKPAIHEADRNNADDPSVNSTRFGPGDHILYVAHKNGAVQILNGFWASRSTEPFFDGIAGLTNAFAMSVSGAATQTKFTYNIGAAVIVLFFDTVEALVWINWKNVPPIPPNGPPDDMRACTLVFGNGAQITRFPAPYSKTRNVLTNYELFRRGDPTVAKHGNFNFDYSGAVLAFSGIESITLHNLK